MGRHLKQRQLGMSGRARQPGKPDAPGAIKARTRPRGAGAARRLHGEAREAGSNMGAYHPGPPGSAAPAVGHTVEATASRRAESCPAHPAAAPAHPRVPALFVPSSSRQLDWFPVTNKQAGRARPGRRVRSASWREKDGEGGPFRTQTILVHPRKNWFAAHFALLPRRSFGRFGFSSRSAQLWVRVLASWPWR